MVKRRGFLKVPSATKAGAVTGVGAGRGASSASSPRTFVLVHGAWHGGWCWRGTAEILAAHGNRVFAPSLTGVGDRAHLFSKDISLQTHVEDILALIEAEELNDFVLVGHSYGGFVISGVADTLRERVSRYVYLDAGVPEDMSPGASFSWSGSNTPEAREARLKSIREQGHGLALPAPPPSAFAVTEPSQVAWLQRRLRPMPLQTYIGTFTFRNSGSLGMARTYVAGSNPPYPFLASTYERIKAEQDWSFTTIEAGHDSMVTAPGKLASLLMEI
ncbi:alpha/beta hydrolase [Cyanobium gracile]|uniref:Alpha/beta hydrolase n=1 Tax=Cyanobium gracile UHCC 0281 TaxID=3110309 RepID=A0ABU5SYK3_9CYAN|nr:alpha/beta hydrolase [Cyanobium gracile]MEA5443595.1 alpha/beta hydrolase [Cyanobium gracile UHCC 0281]